MENPDVQINIGLVPYGYQIDLLIDGKEVNSYCHDFGGSYPVEQIAIEIARWFDDNLARFRREVEKELQP